MADLADMLATAGQSGDRKVTSKRVKPPKVVTKGKRRT
jgi:hypothetical protein